MMCLRRIEGVSRIDRVRNEDIRNISLWDKWRWWQGEGQADEVEEKLDGGRLVKQV